MSTRTAVSDILNILIVTAGLCMASASMANTSESRELKVSYANLDLSKPEHAKRLYSQLRSAAREVCEPLDGRSLRERARYTQCYTDALTKAVAEVNHSAVYALHTDARRARTTRVS